MRNGSGLYPALKAYFRKAAHSPKKRMAFRESIGIVISVSALLLSLYSFWLQNFYSHARVWVTIVSGAYFPPSPNLSYDILFSNDGNRPLVITRMLISVEDTTARDAEAIKSYLAPKPHPTAYTPPKLSDACRNDPVGFYWQSYTIEGKKFRQEAVAVEQGKFVTLHGVSFLFVDDKLPNSATWADGPYRVLCMAIGFVKWDGSVGTTTIASGVLAREMPGNPYATSSSLPIRVVAFQDYTEMVTD